MNDSFNAVVFEAEQVGRVVLEGRGAGEGPTASAVVADVIDIARGRANTAFGMPASALSHAAPVAAGDLTASFYVRMRVKDAVGVAAQIASHVRDAGISMASLLQRGGSSAGGEVIFVLTTHECSLASMEQLTDT